MVLPDRYKGLYCSSRQSNGLYFVQLYCVSVSFVFIIMKVCYAVKKWRIASVPAVIQPQYLPHYLPDTEIYIVYWLQQSFPLTKCNINFS